MSADRVYEGADVMDSRDVIEKLDELKGLRPDMPSKPSAEDWARVQDDPWTEDDEEELDRLIALASEGEGSPDWVHGETLISDSYFETYAQELAEDCGMIKGGNEWPNRCIDWAQAADELKADYFSVEYGETTYWIRG